MNCKYYRTRTKKYKKYGYCIKYKKEVSLFCKECNTIEYKETKSIKKRTYKQTKAEKNRISIFSDIYNCIEKLCENSREKSLAITKLEEAQFWAIKGISREE